MRIARYECAHTNKMKMNLQKIKEMNWREFFKKNKYGVVSVLMLIIYAYAVLLAISFIAYGVRSAFQIDESAANQITTFDMEGYEKIRERFGLE